MEIKLHTNIKKGCNNLEEKSFIYSIYARKLNDQSGLNLIRLYTTYGCLDNSQIFRCQTKKKTKKIKTSDQTNRPIYQNQVAQNTE